MPLRTVLLAAIRSVVGGGEFCSRNPMFVPDLTARRFAARKAQLANRIAEEPLFANARNARSMAARSNVRVQCGAGESTEGIGVRSG